MADSDRRGLLKALAGFLAAGLAAAGSVPVVGSVLTPLLTKLPRPGGFLPALQLDQLETGVPKRVELKSTVVDAWARAVGVVGAAWLLRKPDGSVSALSSVCPHSACSIGLKSKDAFGCPCHDSSFSFDGKPTSGPSPRAMDPLEVQVKNGQVSVRWARFKIGVKERQEL